VQGAVWAEISRHLLRGLRALLESLLEAEVTARVGAGRYERTERRRGHRNGHYTRDLVTTHGPLPRLRVPRLLEDGVDFTLFDRYQRWQAAVDAAIGQLFLQGVSTRKLKHIARDLFGAPVSAGTLSKAAVVLDADLQAYQAKPLANNIPFLFLDGITQKVGELEVEGKVMLCAFGFHRDGRKELLSFRLADLEDTTTWRAFLVDLKSRGLHGKALHLITVDGHPALLKALREIYPLRRIHRCIAHKLRNVVVKLKRFHRESCMAEAKVIFGAPSRTEAIRRFRTWRGKWVVEEERAFREVRRRTRPMGVFTNAASTERIMYGVTQHLNANGRSIPFSKFNRTLDVTGSHWLSATSYQLQNPGAGCRPLAFRLSLKADC
jgi:transposase-like protein